MELSGKAVYVFVFALSTLLLSSFALANKYYWSTTQSVPVGLVLLPLGDANRNGIVDIYDLFMVGKAYGSKLGDLNWNPDCDFNDDGGIDTFDVSIIEENYGLSIYVHQN